MRFKHYLIESISSTVFHKTSVQNAVKIISKDAFRLSASIGTQAEIDVNKGKFFFLSTARSPLSSYIGKSPYKGDLYMELDGDKFNQRFKGFAMDYWGDSFRNLNNEMEDRIVSNKQYIKNAKQYIKAIHVYFSTQREKRKSILDIMLDSDAPEIETIKIDKDRLVWYKELYSLSKKSGIQIHFYIDENAFLTRNTKKTINPLDMFKQEDIFKDQIPVQYISPIKTKSFIAEWVELLSTPIDKSKFNDKEEYTKFIRNKLSKNAYKEVEKLKYYSNEVKSSLSNDIHNIKSTDKIGKLVDIMKKLKLNSVNGIIEYLKQKYVW